MTRKHSRSIAPILTTLVIGLASPMWLACEKSESENAVDNAKDALNLREHEKLRDTGEDAQQAIEDAGSAIKDEAEALREKANKAIHE